MIDRKKVIKALECCANNKPFYHAHCDQCPYNGRLPENEGGCTQLAKDALKLLKEQEPIIRCEDCKHEDYCRKSHTKPDGWFCSDSEGR